MKLVENQGGGTTIILVEGDSLDAVPASHADIVTPELREAFRDPRACFSEIARQTRIKSFQDLLTRYVDNGRWELLLADTYMMEKATVGGFLWLARGVMPLRLEPGETNFSDDDCHPDFRLLYSLVRDVHWGQIAYSGGLAGPGGQITLQDYGCSSESDQFPVESSIVFGNTDCGDVFIHNAQGTAATLSHENGRALKIGSIPEALEWIFNELLSGREPEHDYAADRGDTPTLGLWSPPDDET